MRTKMIPTKHYKVHAGAGLRVVLGVYTLHPALSAAMPDDDTAATEVEDDDGLEHPPDNAQFTAPPKDYRFSPWEELKTHSNLLYSEKPIEVQGKTMSTMRLKVPHRLQ